MDNNERRERILTVLGQTAAPISAAHIAEETGVSRQVIVGDIALLRAEGHDIIATARGYMIAWPQTGHYIGKIACKHDRADTARELAAIVKAGGVVLDVIVTHPYYGDLTGQLNIKTLQDVDDFTKQFAEGASGMGKKKLLSELTGGVHLHSIACSDKQAFDAIKGELARLGFLYEK